METGDRSPHKENEATGASACRPIGRRRSRGKAAKPPLLLSEKLSAGGSFTLSSGFLSHYPNVASVAIGPFSAAVDSFVRSTAPLLLRGVRLNVVSPAPVVPAENVRYGLVSAAQSAEAYAECVEGNFTGRVVRAWGGLEKEPSW